MGLELELRLLLGQEGLLRVMRSPVELAQGGPPAEVVVVDVPAQDRRAVCEQVRRRHRSRLIVLLDQGDSSHDLPPDPNQTLLARPFFVYELAAALAGSGPTQPTADPADQPPPVLPRATRARRAKSRRGSGRSVVTHVVLGLLRSWRERRLVRVSTISLLAALAFTVAFALVNRDAGCGAACDELAGADLTSPSTTVAPVVSWPATTASSTTVAGPTTTHSSVGPATDGRSRVEAATRSRPGIATTRAGSSGTPGPTSPPDPTRPPPTAAPTTAPTTTTPKPSTTTTTTTTTTGP
jgi:hypothetical protein